MAVKFQSCSTCVKTSWIQEVTHSQECVNSGGYSAMTNNEDHSEYILVEICPKVWLHSCTVISSFCHYSFSTCPTFHVHIILHFLFILQTVKSLIWHYYSYCNSIFYLLFQDFKRRRFSRLNPLPLCMKENTSLKQNCCLIIKKKTTFCSLYVSCTLSYFTVNP